MPDNSTVEEILDFAIEQEQEAADFYTALADKASSKATKQTFLQFAGEERGHKAKLVDIKSGKKLLGSADQRIPDLRIAEYVVSESPGAAVDYQGALILAMKKEKAAFRLYSDLASRTEDPAVRDLLLGLAQEEAKHKLRFEIDYDQHVLTEN